jgi:thiaminase
MYPLRDGMQSAYVEGMRKLLEKIEALMTAVAFAEEGEVEVARQIMTEAGVAEPGNTHGKPEHPSPRLYTPHVAKASGA